MPFAVPRSFLASMIAAGLINIVLPFALALWARRRFGVKWAWIGLGALGFFISQPLVHIPLVMAAQRFWFVGRPRALIVFASATAGLCEEVARYVLLSRAIKERSFRSGLGYGIGHGGLEAFLLAGLGGLLGVVQVVALAKLDPSKLPLTPDKLDAVNQAREQVRHLVQAGPLTPLASVWERIWAIAMQIGFSFCVLRAVMGRNVGWLVLAILIHGLVDAVSVLVMKSSGTFAVEALVAIFGLLSIAFVVHEARRLGPTPLPEPS